jgi:hypothetical protein
VATDIAAQLAHDLDIDPAELALFARLDDSEQELLAEAISHAVEQQDHDIDDAIRRSLRLMPRMLRARVRGVLFPRDETDASE